MCKERVEIVTRILQPARLVADRKPHGSGLVGDAEVIEQLDQVGIITVVVDDKSGIHGKAPRPDLYVVGRGMAANAVPGFKYLNAMAPLGQLVGAPQPGDARSYDCNVHR